MSPKNCSLAYSDEMDGAYHLQQAVEDVPSLHLVVNKRFRDDTHMISDHCEQDAVIVSGRLSVSF